MQEFQGSSNVVQLTFLRGFPESHVHLAHATLVHIGELADIGRDYNEG